MGIETAGYSNGRNQEQSQYLKLVLEAHNISALEISTPEDLDSIPPESLPEFLIIPLNHGPHNFDGVILGKKAVEKGIPVLHLTTLNPEQIPTQHHEHLNHQKVNLIQEPMDLNDLMAYIIKRAEEKEQAISQAA